MARLPLFHGDQIYAADTCTPLVRAATAGDLRISALARAQYPGDRMPRTMLPGVKAVGYWDATRKQDWGLDWHYNEGIEITFLESGTLAYDVDDRQYALKADHLTVTRPWQRHRVGKPNVGVSRLHWLILDVGVRRPHQGWRWPDWIVLSPPDLAELTNMLRQNHRAVWQAPTDLRRCFQSIATAVDHDHDGSSGSRLAVHINELFLLILEMFRGQKITLDESLSSSMHTVQLFFDGLRWNPEHLAMPWTLHRMANSCGLGITQFVDHVKRATNRTPVRYLNDCRLEFAARTLIEHPTVSVTDVALDCGFTSSQYFATVFSQRFGVAPRSYRQQHKAD